MSVANFESWIALAIVVMSLVTAWSMNYRTPEVRAFGTMLAALGCFAVVGWFVLVLGTGVLDDPKPNQAPMDSAKPALLWMQAALALAAALALSWAAMRQLGKTDELDLPARNQDDRYGLVSRVLHWTMAILILALIPIGMFASMIPEDAWFRNQYYVVHKTIGVLVFFLLLARLAWNRNSKRPGLDAPLKPVERRWAHRVHILLYILLLAMPITGWVMTSYHGYPTFFFAWEVDPFWGESDAYIIWGTFHKYLLPYLLYIILGAHILGALKHQFIDRHSTALKRMVG